jgi:plasmid stabilization system protein ParE
VALQIVWTPDATQHFNEILGYWVQRNGSNEYSIKLYQKVKSALLVLSRYPESGKLTEKNGIRAKIVRDYYVFYSYDYENLVVVGMSDMRREPEFIASFPK